jgi:sugar/nucleoside kinase (ribokinase family)
MQPPYDVLGLGCTAVDELLYVPRYPEADRKVRVLRSERQGGGLGMTALVAAARLGARCAYAGVLGPDALSQFVEATMRDEGIDTSPSVRRDDACPIHSVIVVDTECHTRNIFYEVAGRTGADDESPAAAIIQAARVLFIDHYGSDGNIRAATIARQAGVAVVADFERDDVPRFSEMLALVDHLIISRDFALKLTGAASPAAAATALWRTDRQAIVVTCGSDGCWSLGNDVAGQPQHLPAFRVETVDTTGCGDVFHGAYAAALARGLPLAERVRFAAAAAAIKATRPGAQAGAPTYAEVETFLQQRGTTA